MSADLQSPVFTDEAAAIQALEDVRWPHGPVCPHCGGLDKIGRVTGKSHRPGLIYCGACKKTFTVKVGTVFEASKVPMTKWWLACHMLSSSKKGCSSHQLMRGLGVTYKTAWFMTHRIREAMRTGSFDTPMGGPGSIVEVDETFIGNKKEKAPKARGYGHKHAVLTLVERGKGSRSFHVDGTSAKDIVPILRKNIARETAVMTDEAGQYAHLDKEFASHEFTRHGKGEYVRGDIHTNTVEGFYSVFKRGMKGVYQHCGEQHLHRYVAEFDFRYNNRSRLGVEDAARTASIMRGAEGKRLTYRRLGGAGKEASSPVG